VQLHHVDGVTIDFSDVEIFFDLSYVRGRDVVGGAPGAERCGGVLIDEGFPVLAGDKRDDAAGGCGCTAVVFAVGWSVSVVLYLVWSSYPRL
jgi:hypothetical protein